MNKTKCIIEEWDWFVTDYDTDTQYLEYLEEIGDLSRVREIPTKLLSRYDKARKKFEDVMWELHSYKKK